MTDPSSVRIVAEALLAAEAEAPRARKPTHTVPQLRRAVAKELNVKEKELRGTAIKEVLHQVVASN